MTQAMLSMLAAFSMSVLLTACGNVGDAPKATTTDSVATIPANAVGDTATGATPANGEAQTLTIDTTKSSVKWKAAKVTRSHDGGFRNLAGSVMLTGDQVTGAKIMIDARTIFSDEEKLTGHLKSDDFFAVEKFPEARFEITSIAPRANADSATHDITGNLTMRGVTKSVTFPANVNVDGGSVTAKADFIINRKDWGIVYTGAPDDLINDDVRIMFDIVAT